MAEMRSPLAGITTPQHVGDVSANGASALTLDEAAPASIVQIAGWTDFEIAVEPLARHLGFAGAGNYRTAQTADAGHLLRLGPDRVWLVSETASSLPADLVAPDHLTQLDVTHGRWIITAEGPALEDLLARLAPIDFRARHFPAGDFVQTAIHKTSVLIWRTKPDRVNIYCPTSATRSLWDYITMTAAPLAHAATATR